MRFDARSTTITTAGTRVQLLNETSRVLWAQFSARNGNTGVVYVGNSLVASTRGFELSPNDSMTLDFRTGAMPLDKSRGSVAMSVFYADTATNGNILDWAVILER